MRALILEDDPTASLRISTMVKRVAPGIDAIATKSTEEAVRTVNDVDIDVAFLDMILPDDAYGGLTVAKTIADSQPTARIVTVSCMDRGDVSAQIMHDLGGFMHIAKPVFQSDIVMALDALIPTQGPSLNSAVPVS